MSTPDLSREETCFERWWNKHLWQDESKDAARAAWHRSRAAAIEACCKAVCEGCGLGWKFNGVNHVMPFTPLDPMETGLMQCRALEIRTLSQQEDGK